MFRVGLELLIAFLVAATFGFGGVGAALTTPARVVSLILCVGFIYYFAVSFVRGRKTEARRRREAERAHKQPESAGSIGLWL